MLQRFPGVDAPNKYVWGAEDPRKIPLHNCASLGDLMATLQICKELDEKDKKDKDNTPVA